MGNVAVGVWGVRDWSVLERKGEEAASFAFSSETDLSERNGLVLAVAGPVMNSEEEKDLASKERAKGVLDFASNLGVRKLGAAEVENDFPALGGVPDLKSERLKVLCGLSWVEGVALWEVCESFDEPARETKG